MPKSFVPSKKRPTPTCRPTRSAPCATKNSKNCPKAPPSGNKNSQSKNATVAKRVHKKTNDKKQQKDKRKKVSKKVVAKVPLKSALGKCKKKPPPASKKADKSEKSEKSHSKNETASAKEPVEVVISVKKDKPKIKTGQKGVVSGKVKKNTIKPSQMRKDILKKLSGKMDEKLESVVNTILEVAVVKKVSKVKRSEETTKDKKKPKDVKKIKEQKETKDVKPDKTEVNELEQVNKFGDETLKSINIVKSEPEKLKKLRMNEEDIRKMEIKKEIIDEFIEEEEKQSKERKNKPFLKKPKNKSKDDNEDLSSVKVSGSSSEKTGVSMERTDGSRSKGKSSVNKIPKKSVLVQKKGRVIKGAKAKKGEDSEEVEKPKSEDLEDMDEEQKAKRTKLLGFWAGPKRHRVASLNAIAKVHCLYENESRGAMLEMLDKSAKGKSDKKKNLQKPGKNSDEDEKKEVPKRSLRTAPGMRSVGRHYDVETSSSSAISSSEIESEDEKSEKSSKPETKTRTAYQRAKEVTKEPENEQISSKEDPVKIRKRRRRCELMMDLKDMVVRKRMASLNASAMLAATYSVEKKDAKSDDRRRKSAQSDSTQSSTEVDQESSDDEVILSGTSKKVAVIVNQDTDVTITGVYVNSTTRSTRHCSITGMQYRISSTSHTQTESAAVTTETVIHTSDHVSVSHSNGSSVEAADSPSGSCKSYTPLGALSSMQPPGNSSPLTRRHPCSSSAFAPPPPYHHHQDIQGYYQPAGPLISHYHQTASGSGNAPAVSGPPSKGCPSPEHQQAQPQAEPPPPPPQDYRPPPFSTAGYPPPPHHNYYSYLQPPYHQECYPYLKYPTHHPGYRRGFWPPGPGTSTGGPMVSADPYGGPLPGPIEPYPPPHAVPQPPQPYPPHYYPHTAAPPACYTHPPPMRAPLFMPESSYQPCPCPTMSTFPKNVHTGPLTGASKGSVQPPAQNSPVSGMPAGLGSCDQQQGQQQQGLSMPNVALALSLDTNNPHHGPPSPARGSAGLPPPASPALSTARNPPSWSPPNITPETPAHTKETKTREDTMTAVAGNTTTRMADPSPPPLTRVAEGPPVLENQVVAGQRRPRPQKRKPSNDRQVSPVEDEQSNDQPPKLEPIVTPKRRCSPTTARSKSEPPKIINRGVKPPPEAPKPGQETRHGPKIMDGSKKTVQKTPISVKMGLTKAKPVPKMLLKNTTKAHSPPLTSKSVVPKNKKENSKTRGVKCEPKRGTKKATKDLALPNPTRTHLNGLKWSNGWSWEGEGFKARVFLAGDESPVYRRCYSAMRHIEGDIICPMDCILLKSGPRKQQLPFIAKVASLWENPDDGEMMISLLWYYRPEHTDQGRQPLQPEDEVFASRHRDTNSVACIEDKCYVLTYNEYCRYKKSLRAADFGVASDKRRVVPSAEHYPRSWRLPPGRIANELLFFCRKVYDFRTKRLLKKPY